MDLRNGAVSKGTVELLAFITMVKNAHSNSVLFEDAAYKMASKIGLSDGRLVKKYLTRCIDMDLCAKVVLTSKRNSPRTVYQFISYSSALTLLLGIKEAQSKLLPLHKGKGLYKFKGYQYCIELDLASLNFAQQAFKVKYNFPNKNYIMQEIKSLSQLPVSERYTRANNSKKRRLLKKFNAADDQNAVSTNRGHLKGVVTGCNHLAKMIGKSSTTGSKRIKKWKEEGCLVVRDEVYFTPVGSHQDAGFRIDALKYAKVKGIHVYSKKEGGIKTIVGKQVLGFANGRFAYGTLMPTSTNRYDNSNYTFSK